MDDSEFLTEPAAAVLPIPDDPVGDEENQRAILAMFLEEGLKALAARDFEGAGEQAGVVLLLSPRDVRGEDLLAAARRGRFATTTEPEEERRWDQRSARLRNAGDVSRFDTRDLVIGGICLAVFLLLLCYQPEVEEVVRDYPATFPLAFVGLKMAAIVFPPLTGGVIGLSGIAFFGWKVALLLDYAGTLTGAVIAFLIARRFRGTVVHRFWPIQMLTDLVERQARNGQYFSRFLLIRLFTEGVFDFLSYAAGLTRMTFGAYFAATALGCLPVKIGMFYVASLGFSTGMIVAILMFFGIGILALTQKPSRFIVRRLAHSPS